MNSFCTGTFLSKQTKKNWLASQPWWARLSPRAPNSVSCVFSPPLAGNAQHGPWGHVYMASRSPLQNTSHSGNADIRQLPAPGGTWARPPFATETVVEPNPGRVVENWGSSDKPNDVPSLAFPPADVWL